MVAPVRPSAAVGERECQQQDKDGGRDHDRRGGRTEKDALARRAGQTLAGEQREVRYGGGHGELPARLGSANEARLAKTELHQAGQAVFGGLSPATDFPEGGALLEGTRRLEQPFLGMEPDGAHRPAGRSTVGLR